MSDGALSQEEIDSLLAGLDGGSSPAQAPAAAPSRGGGPAPSPEAQAFKPILDSIVATQSQNLSMITGLPVNVQPPQVDLLNRDAFLREVPEEVLAINVPFAGSLPGEHVFILGKELSLRVAALANKDEGLVDLDDMAVSAVQECASTLTGSEITTISEKTGNRNLQSGVAEGGFGPKAMARVPSGDMLRAIYQVKIGDDQPERLIELFSLAFVKDVLASSGSGGFAAPSQGRQAGFGGAGFGGGGMQQQQQQQGMGMGQQGMMQQGMGQQQGYGGFGQQNMPQQGFPGYGQQGMGVYPGGMSAPNVQPIQFASLQMQQASPESGNIGLIMDVFMEMTVELGRTRKLIKEILGMGEGTIIELDKLAGEPVDILVNHKLIAKGEVVVIDENFGVRVTEIVSPMERMSDLG
jgi:flagellar motor switch protein FliN/FliY